MESIAYKFLLFLHSLLRWVVLLSFSFTFFRLVYSVLKKENITEFCKFGHKLTMILVDVQFLIGMLLYLFYSPIVQTALADFKTAMKTKELRFFAIEHLVIMSVVLILLHIANVILKREINPQKVSRILLGTYVFILALFIVGIPWFRPMFRGI